jgi:CheY-like chemotaxis protein
VDAAVIASPDKPGDLTGTLLLVEDNDEVASSTAFVLRSAGLQVIRAAHAAQALALLQADAAPDVVLSDIAMPGEMNGIALAFELRRTHPALPVLLTTGYAEQVRQATADGLRVLPKPLDPDTLLAELRTVLSRTG